MKKCESCEKLLSDFEVRFHSEAGSPAAISGKCFRCCGAKKTFGGADVENGGHKKQIFACIASLVLIFIASLPLLPYLNSYELSLLLELYSALFFVICIVIGAGASYVIAPRFLRKHKAHSMRIDPPEQRYSTCYTPEKSYLEAKEQIDGSFRIEKITRGGTSQVDRWEWYGTSNERVNGILGAYGRLIEIVIYLTAYMFLGASFIFWAIPYLVYAILKNKMSEEKRAKIPADLQKAYKISLAASEKMPLTYHDKVGFLVSRENCKKAPASASQKTDGFLSNFVKTEAAAPEKHLPFFFKRYGKTAYMIVDYKEGKDPGTTFVLVKKENAPIEKRIVVGHSFADTQSADWEADYSALGASAARYNMAWYEAKMTELLKNPKKEILG